MKPLTTLEAAAQVGLSEQRIRALCAQGRIRGVEKHGRSWILPANFTISQMGTRGPKQKCIETRHLIDSPPLSGVATIAPRTSPGTPKSRRDIAAYAEVLKQYRDGATQAAIAKQLGVSRQRIGQVVSVAKWLETHGTLTAGQYGISTAQRRLKDPQYHEKARKATAKWRHANPDHAKSLVKEWRTNNPEKTRQYNAAQYKKRRAKKVKSS